jgi:hypothetical protein
VRSGPIGEAGFLAESASRLDGGNGEPHRCRVCKLPGEDVSGSNAVSRGYAVAGRSAGKLDVLEGDFLALRVMSGGAGK